MTLPWYISCCSWYISWYISCCSWYISWYISCCEIPMWRDVWLAQNNRVKSYNLPQVNESSKIVYLNFAKVRKLTKINCPELLRAASNFHRFRKKKREREREKVKDRVKSLKASLFLPNFWYPNCCTLNCLA